MLDAVLSDGEGGEALAHGVEDGGGDLGRVGPLLHLQYKIVREKKISGVKSFLHLEIFPRPPLFKNRFDKLPPPPRGMGKGTLYTNGQL